MYWYELQDMLFITKCIKTPSGNIDIHMNISLLQVLQDLYPITNWSQTSNVLLVIGTSISIILLSNGIHFQTFDTSISMTSIKTFLTMHHWNNFITHFNPEISCTFHFVCTCINCYMSDVHLILLDSNLFLLWMYFFLCLSWHFLSFELNSFTSSCMVLVCQRDHIYAHKHYCSFLAFCAILLWSD